MGKQFSGEKRKDLFTVGGWGEKGGGRTKKKKKKKRNLLSNHLGAVEKKPVEYPPNLREEGKKGEAISDDLLHENIFSTSSLQPTYKKRGEREKKKTVKPSIRAEGEKEKKKDLP